MHQSTADDFELRERWRAIPGYEGFYEVSNLGRVRSVARAVKCSGGVRHIRTKVLKPSLDQDGYHIVSITSARTPSKAARLHKLVLLAFVGPKPEGMECLHRDGIRGRNVLTNLRYGTPVENWEDRKRHGRGVSGASNPNSHWQRAKRTQESSHVSVN